MGQEMPVTPEMAPMTNPETEIILKALSDRLKAISEVEKGKVI